MKWPKLSKASCLTSCGFWLRPSGVLPLGFLLTRSLRDLARRKPQLFDRLGEHAATCFSSTPPTSTTPSTSCPMARARKSKWWARRTPRLATWSVRGPLLSLLGLLDGTFDGDALFFSRSISISGKVDALLALRNAIEDADLKPSDFIGVGGSIGSARRQRGFECGCVRPAAGRRAHGVFQ